MEKNFAIKNMNQVVKREDMLIYDRCFPSKCPASTESLPIFKNNLKIRDFFMPNTASGSYTSGALTMRGNPVKNVTI